MSDEVLETPKWVSRKERGRSNGVQNLVAKEGLCGLRTVGDRDVGRTTYPPLCRGTFKHEVGRVVPATFLF